MPATDHPSAYLITFHTYGSWLHGELKGSVDRQHNRPGTEFAAADSQRLKTMQARMNDDAVKLNKVQRDVVKEACSGVCLHRGWDLLAIHVRTNHVHVVIAAPTPPDAIMKSLKSWATRKLREAELLEPHHKVWSRHGSTRYLWKEKSVENACRYVMEGQGVDL